jgi:hypothetical protein
LCKAYFPEDWESQGKKCPQLPSRGWDFLFYEDKPKDMRVFDPAGRGRDITILPAA